MIVESFYWKFFYGLIAMSLGDFLGARRCFTGGTGEFWQIIKCIWRFEFD
jgi:hypothetical protein